MLPVESVLSHILDEHGEWPLRDFRQCVCEVVDTSLHQLEIFAAANTMFNEVRYHLRGGQGGGAVPPARVRMRMS